MKKIITILLIALFVASFPLCYLLKTYIGAENAFVMAVMIPLGVVTALVVISKNPQY